MRDLAPRLMCIRSSGRENAARLAAPGGVRGRPCRGGGGGEAGRAVLAAPRVAYGSMTLQVAAFDVRKSAYVVIGSTWTRTPWFVDFQTRTKP